jgi:hypothetical protein
MITPHNMTIYKKSIVGGLESWASTQVTGVLWEQRKAANVLRSGLLAADSAAIYIPLARGDIGAKVGDVAVKGLVTDAITPSFTMSALKAKYPNNITIKSVDTLDFGSAFMQHVKLSGG